jgi:prepilin-type N-terminal cleavage/methylation domain-containing protein
MLPIRKMNITPKRHPSIAYRLPADVQEEDLRRHAPLDEPHQNAGFSMIEISIVILLISVFAGFALLNIEGIMPGMEANAALSQTVAQLRRGRELAIAQRRNIEVRFLDNNQIQLVRFDVPNGRTVLSTVILESGIEFQVFNGVPDTPESFGNGAAVDFGGSDTLIFLSDGTLVDAEGNPLHGSVFLGLPDHPETARAVTILGATGRVRGYRWTGSSWIQ